MEFFAAFSSLGYSAITLIVAFVFIAGVLWNALKMYARPIWMRVVLLLAVAAGFVFATLYLAEQRAILMDDLRNSDFKQRESTPSQ